MGFVNRIRYQKVSDSLNIAVNSAGTFCNLPQHSLVPPNADFEQLSYSNLRELNNRAAAYQKIKREYTSSDLSYLILVPTLRCNLTCTYCQVSRVSESANGFDWCLETERNTYKLIEKINTDSPKIEFQGGEPFLRLDILERVRDFCRQRFSNPEFVVCSNLQHLDQAAWAFLKAPDTHLSTSFDGATELHVSQRTKTAKAHQKFLENLHQAIELMGIERVSALPTLDIDKLPPPREIIENFAYLGLRSIFLRPVNHHGFARKKHNSLNRSGVWNRYRRKFIAELISYNVQNENWMEEFYLSLCLRRIFQPGNNDHVDLRNPNPMGKDYLVVDYDGVLYPTDEARMITRSGQIDLSIGSVNTGVDNIKLDKLNGAKSNHNDKRCSVCAYQTFCGVDRIDDISRYGTIELDRHETDFCLRHMDIFDHIFEMIYSRDQDTKKSLAFWLGISEFDPLLAPELT